MINIRRIEHGSPDYKKAVDLRYLVLRKPLGLNYSQEQLSAESNEYHFIAERMGEIVGCLLLKPLENETVQMRQVAVAENFQGKGIGKLLVKHSEEFALKNGYKKIILHARDTAIEFYKSLGYSVTSEMYYEVTIPHYTMEKNLLL